MFALCLLAVTVFDVLCLMFCVAIIKDDYGNPGSKIFPNSQNTLVDYNSISYRAAPTRTECVWIEAGNTKNRRMCATTMITLILGVLVLFGDPPAGVRVSCVVVCEGVGSALRI